MYQRKIKPAIPGYFLCEPTVYNNLKANTTFLADSQNLKVLTVLHVCRLLKLVTCTRHYFNRNSNRAISAGYACALFAYCTSTANPLFQPKFKNCIFSLSCVRNFCLQQISRKQYCITEIRSLQVHAVLPLSPLYREYLSQTLLF